MSRFRVDFGTGRDAVLHANCGSMQDEILHYHTLWRLSSSLKWEPAIVYSFHWLESPYLDDDYIMQVVLLAVERPTQLHFNRGCKHDFGGRSIELQDFLDTT